MATVPTPEVCTRSLARPDESLIEPPRPVIRAGSGMDHTPPEVPGDPAAVYLPGTRSEDVDPDNPEESGESTSQEDSSASEESGSSEASGGLERLAGEDPEDSSEASAGVEPDEEHQINLFA